jgi:hypothetical protein
MERAVLGRMNLQETFRPLGQPVERFERVAGRLDAPLEARDADQQRVAFVRGGLGPGVAARPEPTDQAPQIAPQAPCVEPEVAARRRVGPRRSGPKQIALDRRGGHARRVSRIHDVARRPKLRVPGREGMDDVGVGGMLPFARLVGEHVERVGPVPHLGQERIVLGREPHERFHIGHVFVEGRGGVFRGPPFGRLQADEALEIAPCLAGHLQKLALVDEAEVGCAGQVVVAGHDGRQQRAIDGARQRGAAPGAVRLMLQQQRRQCDRGRDADRDGANGEDTRADAHQQPVPAAG